MIISVKEKYLFPGLAVLALIVVLSLTIFPAHIYQWSPPCFFKKELDLYCAFCGGFRSITFLVQGDFVKAWFYNPLVTVAAAYILFQIIKNGISIWQGMAAPFKISMYKFYLFLVFIIGFTILRNTSIYPYHFY